MNKKRDIKQNMLQWQYENCKPGTKAEKIMKSMAEVEQILEKVEIKKKKHLHFRNT